MHSSPHNSHIDTRENDKHDLLTLDKLSIGWRSLIHAIFHYQPNMEILFQKYFSESNIIRKIPQLVQLLYFLGVSNITSQTTRQGQALVPPLYPSKEIPDQTKKGAQIANAIFILVKGLDQISIQCLQILFTLLPQNLIDYPQHAIELKNKSLLPNYYFIRALLQLYFTQNNIKSSASFELDIFKKLDLKPLTEANSAEFNKLITRKETVRRTTPPRPDSDLFFSPDFNSKSSTPSTPLLPQTATRNRCFPWCSCFGCRHA